MRLDRFKSLVISTIKQFVFGFIYHFLATHSHRFIDSHAIGEPFLSQYTTLRISKKCKLRFAVAFLMTKVLVSAFESSRIVLAQSIAKGDHTEFPLLPPPEKVDVGRQPLAGSTAMLANANDGSSPDLAAFFNAVILMLGEHMHFGSRDRLLGPPPSPAIVAEFSLKKRVCVELPPCLFAMPPMTKLSHSATQNFLLAYFTRFMYLRNYLS